MVEEQSLNCLQDIVAEFIFIPQDFMRLCQIIGMWRSTVNYLYSLDLPCMRLGGSLFVLVL